MEIQNIIISYLKDYNPAYVGLFGSFVRGDGTDRSVIDILVRFNNSYSLLQLIKLENELVQDVVWRTIEIDIPELHRLLKKIDL